MNYFVHILILLVILLFFSFYINISENYDLNIYNVFNNIYKKKIWSEQGGGSGTGSSVENTQNFRNILTEFVIDKNINSFLDVPCGSCVWTKKWLSELQTKGHKIYYFGIDISEEAIEKCKNNNNSNYHIINYKHGDIATEILPTVDALLCRDTLQHLSYDNIWKCLKNFSKCKAKYYIIGGYNENEKNKNIKDGEYFYFNIVKEPFSYKPDFIFMEKNLSEPEKLNKFLFIFEGENFRKQALNKI